ncbi:MAG: Asp-tRNA(Asn)/Glu-tRNA(Gln) amidotransferase subunit GatA [Candidatus Pacebacteria bacterium]|nr:Asp-tRNA(Asn)/Glu-tRNA(Gln) amidotransferase subunit GatA [Candidatus Paceibacterota bacterium]
MIDLKNLTIKKTLESLQKGEYTSVELVSAYLEQIKKVNADVNAYLEVYEDALVQAKVADEKRATRATSGNAGLDSVNSLLGIPFAIKDNILFAGHRASASSKILEQYVAPYDATVIAMLKEAGAVFIGRVNMDEFAMGGSTENSAYGVTKNPHDLERVSGGSSGGSAATVAMDGALISLGSDTGGSIRQPASYCGVVGLKPTYGRVSRHGLMAMGSSLDVIGPITKTVEDAELVFNAIACVDADRYDSTTLTKKEVEEMTASHNINPEKKPTKLRVGIVPELMNLGGLSNEVKENLDASIELFKKAGYEIKEIAMPNMKYSLAVYYILMPAEVSSNMARFDGVKYGSKVEGADLLQDYLNTRGELLGKEVRKRIMLGTYVLSSGYHDAYYNKANIAKDLIASDFKKAFEEVDVILTPTAPTPAFKIGAHTSDPVAMYLEDIFTVTANLVGVPAISIPSGFAEVDGESAKLPLGIQLMAPHCREDILFVAGKKFEELRG